MFYLILTLICFGTLFLSSSSFIDPQILPKWYAMFYGNLLGSIYYATRSVFYPLNIRSDKQRILKAVWIIVLFCALQGMYMIFQYIEILPSIGHRLAGSFDNPAGFAASLCAGFPLCFLFCKKQNDNIQKFLALLCSIIIYMANTSKF